MTKWRLLFRISDSSFYQSFLASVYCFQHLFFSLASSGSMTRNLVPIVTRFFFESVSPKAKFGFSFILGLDSVCFVLFTKCN